jgi:hypothetical protein
MTALKTAALAAAVLGGSLATAEAQYYGHYGHGYGHHGYYRPAPPVYVPPRIARKQAQLQERFVEKFGYVQPQPQWGHHYHRPRPQVQYYYGW